MDDVPKYNVNDRVWLYCPKGDHAGLTRKFTRYWRGPYVVVEKMSDLTYRVKAEGAKRVESVNIDRMLPFKTRREVIGVPLATHDHDDEFDDVYPLSLAISPHSQRP